MVSRASAWASPEVTPVSQTADEEWVVQSSELVQQGEWVSVLPTSPRGLATLAQQKGWALRVRAAVATKSDATVSSWSVSAISPLDGSSIIAVWEQHSGEVAESKKKCHVTMAYVTGPLVKTNVTTLKNILKESA